MLKPNPGYPTTGNYGMTLHLLVMNEQGIPLALVPLPRELQDPFSLKLPGVIDGELDSPKSSSKRIPARHLIPESVMVRHVESALRRLFDLAYLCDHPLADLRTVKARIQAQNKAATCLARARILSALLTEAIEQLRPDGPIPGRAAIPRRDWHPYLILYRAYLEGETNYRLMNWLQIGEGTFNRTRRSALHAVAKVLQEMEAEVE